ncbi:MAG: AAA family ATPase [Prevotella sp.]|nr:AAA family ATPase [Candidatus Prevotella equi]
MENKELELAYRIIANTDTHLFLTGKAGTGKTTFLRNLRTTLPKRMVVVAPTGIAAINAQGTTIHSFFQLNFGPQIPGMQQAKKYQFKKSKLKLIRSIDLIVIDEISMVRADVLDAIDSVLKQYRDRNRPFGGVQMLMIGDMQQLAPVAKEDEWRMLSQYYSTPYFFSSKVLQQADFVTVELQHVYRQSDEKFLQILNKVRTNTADDNTLAMLNKRYIAEFTPEKKDGYIRLTTHNYQADEINHKELEALDTPQRSFKAVITGDFPESSFPTEQELTLKTGAQVMFVKNDSSFQKQYYNGMIGEVVDFDDDIIRVRATDNGAILEVGHETWENTKYDIDAETKEITEEIVGTFAQYPLKTAWAITVHKSQGLTFEHAIIDVQHSFAHGQTYVALSRCKSLEGMVLSTPIPRSAIICDNMVNDFNNDPRHQQPDEQRMECMQRQYLLRTIEELFSFNQLRYGFTDIIRCMREHFYTSHPKAYTSWTETSEKFKEVESVAARFHKQYQNLVLTLPDVNKNIQLQERLIKGAEYFRDNIVFVGNLLQKTSLPTDNKQVKERITNLLQTMEEAYKLKFQLLHYVANNGLILQEYLKQKAKLNITIEEELDPKSSKTSKRRTTTKSVSKEPFKGKQSAKRESIMEWVKGYMNQNNSHDVNIEDLPY